MIYIRLQNQELELWTWMRGPPAHYIGHNTAYLFIIYLWNIRHWITKWHLLASSSHDIVGCKRPAARFARSLLQNVETNERFLGREEPDIFLSGRSPLDILWERHTSLPPLHGIMDTIKNCFKTVLVNIQVTNTKAKLTKCFFRYLFIYLVQRFLNSKCNFKLSVNCISFTTVQIIKPVLSKPVKTSFNRNIKDDWLCTFRLS